MFILKENGLEFAFDSQIGVKNEGGFYESEINGAIPVPKLLSTDRIILPIDEGIALNADGEYENGEIGYDFNNLSYKFCSREGTLSMIVIERDKKYLMIALESGLYSKYSLKKENGLYTLSIYNEKPCKVFYKVFENIVTLCREYKLVKKINAVTLKQKAAENPLVNNLFGGAIFWIWNDNYDEVMYSDYECGENPQTGEKLLEIAGELKSEGVDKALFSIFFEGDSKYVEDLYKEYGYISTQYDNYNDVLNPELLSVIPNKPFIISSYKRIAEVSKYTITEPITDYKILSEDYSLQQTVFGGRYSVTVNFSEKEQIADGKIILPEDLLFEII